LAVRTRRAALDPSVAAAAGPVIAGVVRAAQRAATDGAGGFQLAVPLVRGPGDGCGGLGCDGVQQESRPLTAGRGVATLAGGGSRTGASARLAERRALHGGWHAAGGVGESG